MIQDYVDKVFVINMDKDTKRLEYMTNHLGDLGIPFERHQGVDVSKDKDLVYNLTPICKKYCTNGVKGSGTAHITGWIKMIDMGLSNAMFLEDDCIFVNGFWEKMDTYMSHVPTDYDMILLGCNCLCSESSNYTFLEKFFNSFVLRGKNKNKKINEHVIRVKKFFGIHAYILSNKGAQKFIKNIPEIYQFCDLMMATEAQKNDDIIVYGPINHLVNQIIENEGSNNVTNFKPSSLSYLLKNVKADVNTTLPHLLAISPWKYKSFQVNIWLGLFLVSGMIITLMFKSLVISIQVIIYFILFDICFNIYMEKFNAKEISNYSTILIGYLTGCLAVKLFTGFGGQLQDTPDI